MIIADHDVKCAPFVPPACICKPAIQSTVYNEINIALILSRNDTIVSSSSWPRSADGYVTTLAVMSKGTGSSTVI